MANNVYDRFREELLVQKNVKLVSDIFKKYHREIFPDPDAFIRFLQPQMQDETVSAAKQLYDLLQFSLICPIPKVYSDKLLYVESETNDLAGVFVAQDHYVHSVYLYLTGIYVFFNHASIHEQIMAQLDWVEGRAENPFSDPYCEKVKVFLRMWTYFALYHDLGYSFEKTIIWINENLRDEMRVDPRVKLDSAFFEAFNEPEEYISYEFALKTLSSYLLFAYITSHSKGTAADLKVHTSDSWTKLCMPSMKAETSSTAQVAEVLAKFDFYGRLSKVSTYRNLVELFPFVDTERIITAAYTNRGKLYAIKTLDCVFYCNDIGDLSAQELANLELLGCDEAADLPYYCEYFYFEDQDRSNHLLRELGIYSFVTEITQALSTIVDENSALFSMLTRISEFRIIRYNLYSYLRCQFPLTAFKKKAEERLKKLHSRNIRHAFEAAVNKTVQEHLSKMESYENIDKLYDEECIERELSALLKELSELKPDTVKLELDSSKERSLKSIQTLLDLLKKMQYKIKGNTPTKIPLIECSKKDDILFVNVHPLSIQGVRKKTTPAYKHHRECFMALANKLQESLRELGFLADSQGVDVFLSYIPPKTCLDHGVISASLLANCLLAHQIISQNITSSKGIPSVLSSPSEGNPLNVVDREIEMVWKTAFFSILIHNIYSEAYAKEQGLRYMQRLDVNAFSYLCALCDSLQFWDRPRQFNPAIHDSGKVYYAGNSDIEVIGDHIIVTCTGKDIEREDWDRKKNLSEFLLDATSIICLNVAESI